jgi:hypothetical protein
MNAVSILIVFTGLVSVTDRSPKFFKLQELQSSICLLSSLNL